MTKELPPDEAHTVVLLFFAIILALTAAALSSVVTVTLPIPDTTNQGETHDP